MALLSRAERKGEMPGPQSALIVMDRAMKAAARKLEQEVLPRVRQAAPGRLGKTFRAKRRLAQGVDVSIGPRGKRAFIVPFVAGGTGIYGPRGQPIRRKDGQPFVITAGDGTVIRTDEIRGQRPNPFLAPVASWADRRAVEISEEMLAEAAQTITDRNL